MWQIGLAALIVAGLMHGYATRKRGPGRIPEMMLVYLLVGYCGLAQIAVGVIAVVNPDFVATEMARVPAGNPIMLWAGFMFVGMGLAAALTAFLRGTYIIGPVVAWSIFWLGATYAHVVAEGVHGGHMSHGGLLMIFAAHGLIGVLLIVLTLWWLIARGRAARQSPAA
jgi:hypothetical protein